MTTANENELLTRVGPGTPMGELMRQYWIPAAMSSEVEADGAPLRLMLLGEKLIAFRDTAGRVGVMDHRCPHRCASLYFGRNEEEGLRCIYHGWKFDVDGNCLDMANVPPEQDFKHKVRAKAYKAAERNGIIWVYMGARRPHPPLPVIEPALLPEKALRLRMIQRECNWLQAMEGDIDTTHFSFLHAGGVQEAEIDPEHPGRYNVTQRTADFHVMDTPWGTMYGAYRPAAKNYVYWRVAHFLFPFWTYPPDGFFDKHIIGRAWVPMDDTHTMFVHLSWTENSSGVRKDVRGNTLPGMDLTLDFKPNSSDWYGRWQLVPNKSNDYLIDRRAQRSGNYSGLTGIHLQDQAITESMGKITDHSFEHLAPTDRMISRTRKRLVNAALSLQRSGTIPQSVDEPEIMLGARGGDFLAPSGQKLYEAYIERLAAAEDPTGKLDRNCKLSA